jgi:poly-beta-1,6-N-acetyl-D-glucosamine synthase
MLTLVLISFILAFLYLFMTLPAHLGWFLNRRTRIRPLEDLPFISILIPAHNEKENIRKCIDSILNQDYPAFLMEIIVIDDYSDDGTIEHLADYTTIRCIRNDGRRGKKAALYQGIQASKAELLVCTDADCTLQPGHLRLMAGFYQQNGVKLVLGAVRMRPGLSFASSFAALDFLSLQAVGAGFALGGRPVLSNGANLAFSREAFNLISGSIPAQNLASGDDMFLLQAMSGYFGNKSIGYIRDPGSIVDTSAPATWVGLFRQRLRWVSKARHYKAGFTLFLAIVVAGFNSSIPLLLGAGLFHYTAMLAGFLLLGLKMLIDMPLLRSFAAHSGQSGLMRWYLPTALLYPFYAAILTVLGLLTRPHKKGW